MDGEEQAYFSELPVVVTVTRLPQNPLELPASLTVIGRDEIEASGALTVPDLLRLVAGFQTVHVSGVRSSVMYHGMGDEYARRIQVLLDGRSIYMPANGGVDWADIPLSIEDIDRIEVLRGPNGVAFGSDSFMGVVNIITQHAAATRGTQVKLQAGEGEYRKLLVREGGRLGDLDYRLTLEQSSDDGFDDVDIRGYTYSQKDDKRSNKVALRGDYRVGINDYLTFQAGLNSGPRGQGYYASRKAIDTATLPPIETHNWRHYQQAKWRRILSSDEEFQFHFYHNYTDTAAHWQTAPLSDIFGVDPTPYGIPNDPLLVSEDIKAERYNMEFEHRLRLSDTLRMVWGWEGRFDQVWAPGYLSQEEAVENRLFRLFAHGEWRPVPEYLINAGAMVEQNDVSGTNVSPRLAINRHLAPGHAMRLSYTQAYRDPVMLEEYADFAARHSSDGTVFDQLWKSAGDLESERITAYELGFMGELGGPRLQYDFKLFKEILRDLIAHPYDGQFVERYSALCAWYEGFCDALVFENRDWADLEGFEAQLRIQPDEATTMTLGFSHVYAKGYVTEDVAPTGGYAIDEAVPSHTLSFLFDHRFGDGWRGSVGVYHVDRLMVWHATSVTTVDLRLARRFKAAGHEGTLALVARDVGGSYYDMQDEMVITPRVYLSLDYRF